MDKYSSIVSLKISAVCYLILMEHTQIILFCANFGNVDT